MAKTAKKKNDHSSRFNDLVKQVDKTKTYEIDEAIKAVKATASAKFVETVDMAVRLGVDAKKSDQNVRGITNLPHGTGKVPRVAVLAKGEAAAEAKAAGADEVGDEDLIKRIQDGDKDLKFDIMLAHEDMAPQIGKIGRFLGGKTPNKRNGTVTAQIGAAVKDLKAATRVEYRLDKASIVHLAIGKVNFTEEQLRENFLAALDALIKAKPSTSKGIYLKSISLSSTMGPSVRLDTTLAAKASGH